MKFFGWNLFERKSDQSLDQVLARLSALTETASGISVTPDNCEESPTVQAIVNAVSSALATLPVHVYRKSLTSDGREKKELQPSHPVERLLASPNEWQCSTSYWLDAASTMVRHGRFFAVKARGLTGPIRRLEPVEPAAVTLRQGDDNAVRAIVTRNNGTQQEYRLDDLHHVRGRARDFLNGESPVWKAREAIALEIAAQRFGAQYFGNGAMPGLIFSYLDGVKGHMNAQQRDEFLQSVQRAYGQGGRFRAMLMPAGMAKPEQMAVENERAQFLETRKLQRNVIAGAFGVPPHLVGDLERSTFSNIEHQSQEFLQKVVHPYARMFESAMERDLLTVEDRRAGLCVRFNLDAGLRADFKTRQEGLKIQREAGVISPNDWRENEGMNPIPAAQGGDAYWTQGPSGQGSLPPADASAARDGATHDDPTQ